MIIAMKRDDIFRMSSVMRQKLIPPFTSKHTLILNQKHILWLKRALDMI